MLIIKFKIKFKSSNFKTASIYDIAPTVLHIFGLPIPRNMDGEVLINIFKENSELAQIKSTVENVNLERDRVKMKIKRLKKSNLK